MASPGHNHQSYGFTTDPVEPLSLDYCHNNFTKLDQSTNPSLCSGTSPFLQGPVNNSNLATEEQQQVVVASNDLPVSDMDLANFLEMDDKALSGMLYWSISGCFRRGVESSYLSFIPFTV